MQYQPYHDDQNEKDSESVDRIDYLLHQVGQLDQQLLDSNQQSNVLLQAQWKLQQKTEIDNKVSRTFQVILIIAMSIILITLLYTYVQLCQILKSPTGLKLDILSHI